MSYIYYPGCSAKATGKPYEESLLAVFETLGIPLDELQGWNCCGATAYMSIDETKAFALAARNMALAEQQRPGRAKDPVDLVTPCAACWLVLYKAQRYMREYPEVREEINDALRAAGLTYAGRVRLRHPLDILVNDIGLDKIRSQVKQPLEGLRVACYYGCQLVRPFAVFDRARDPITMDNLMETLGAKPVDWPLKTRCCGGSLSGTIRDVGVRLSFHLLKEAARRGSEVVATACPLCQFNLECFQSAMGRQSGEKVEMPVAFFTQILGLALGIPERRLGMQRLFLPLVPHQTAHTGAAHATA